MKRRANGTGSITKRTRDGKTWWEARISVGYDPVTGNRIRKSYSGATQREVREKMQRDAVAIQDGEFYEPSKMAYATWLNIWLADYCNDKRPQTVKGYRATVNTHLIPHFGKTKLSELTTPMVQKLYNKLAKDGKTVRRKDKKTGETVTTREPLSPKTIKNVHAVVSASLEQARRLGYIKRNPAADATTPRITKRKIRPLTGNEIPAYLNAAAEDRWSYALRLLPFSGLRESELLGLTWDCVDFGRNAITVDKQLLKRGKADGGYTLAPTKSDNIRTVVLAPSAMDLLRQRQRQQIEHRLQAGEAWIGWKTPAEQRRALVFTTEQGEHMTPNSLYYHVKKILTAIGCGDRDVHDLRHTYATLSLQNGMDIKTLQMSLGHATAAFTLDTYAHVSEQMQQQAAEGMEQYISGLK